MQMEKSLNNMMKQKEKVKDHHQNNDAGSNLNISVLAVSGADQDTG